MQLQLQTFTTLVAASAASVQASARVVLDLTAGSVLRAILEANAAMALWLQWLIVQVLQMTRASTSNGADLDSWMADFTLSRLPAIPAQGNVVLGRFSALSAARVPVSGSVRTGDGGQSFVIVDDPRNPAYIAPSAAAPLGAYSLGVGISSVTVPVRAVVPAPGETSNPAASA